jgi:hypothetical protein
MKLLFYRRIFLCVASTVILALMCEACPVSVRKTVIGDVWEKGGIKLRRRMDEEVTGGWQIM